MNLFCASQQILCVLTLSFAMNAMLPLRSPASPGEKEPLQTVQAKLMAMERGWGQAYITGDIEVVDRILAPDWRGWLDQSGWDKATELADFKAGKSRSLENTIDQERVRVFGDAAIVEARERVRARDKDGEHWITWHITDVFVRHDGKWQVVATHESSLPNP